MSIEYPQSAVLNDAIKQNTERFFDVADRATDEELAALVKSGICLEAKDSAPRTPLIIAAQAGLEKTVRALLAAGADMEACGPFNRRSLDWAIRNARMPVARILIAAGADIEAKDIDGVNALILSAQADRVELLPMLINRGAQLESRDSGDNTALIKAAWGGHTEFLEAIIAAGANIEARNESGESALRLAARHRNHSIMILLKRGANIYMPKNAVDVLRDYVGAEEINYREGSYKNLINHGLAPTNAAQLYELLSATPSANTKKPVDYIGNVQKIFAQTKWENKEQAANILNEMQKDGVISAEIAESILISTFPSQYSQLAALPKRNERAR